MNWYQLRGGYVAKLGNVSAWGSDLMSAQYKVMQAFGIEIDHVYRIEWEKAQANK